MNASHSTLSQARSARVGLNGSDVLSEASQSASSTNRAGHHGEAADDPPQTIRQKLTQGFLALVDQGFVSLNTFLTLILVAKLGGQSAVNLYVLAWSILNVARVLQERMIGAPYVVFAHQDARDQQSFLGSSLIQQAIFSSATLVLFGLLSAVTARTNWLAMPDGMAVCLATIAIAGPMILLRDHLRVICCAHFKYPTAVFLSGSALLIQLALIVGVFLLGWLNAPFVFAAMGVASLLPAIVWFAARSQPFRLERQQATADWKTTFQYSRWLVAARVFPTVASCLLPFIALWMIDADASGAFGSCMTLANVSLIFVYGANNFFQPRAVKAFNQQGKKALCAILLESALFFGVVLSVLCGVYFLLGGQLLTIMLTEEFSEFGHVVGILGIYALIVSFSIVAGNGMAALGQPQGLFAGEVAFSIVTIVLAVLLCGSMGIAGVAWALVGGGCVATVIAVAFFVSLLRQVPNATPLETIGGEA
jgi:O-antigen/teichoic acid export membrane protein